MINTSPRSNVTPPNLSREHANRNQRQVATGSEQLPLRNMQSGATSCVSLQLLHVDDARDRLDRAGDLRRDLEAAGQLHLHLGLEVEHDHQRDLAVAIRARRDAGTADSWRGAVRAS